MNIFDVISRNYPHRDKVRHAGAGLVVSVVAGVFVSPVLAFAAGAVVGLAKEAYDMADNGDPSVMDFFATAVGSVIGAALHSIFG